MQRFRLLALGTVIAAASSAILSPTGATAAPGAAQQVQAVRDGGAVKYLVLLDGDANASAVAKTMKARGEKVTSVNKAIGMLEVTTNDTNFRRYAGKVNGVEAVAADRKIGEAPKRENKIEREALTKARAAAKAGNAAAAQDRKKPKKNAKVDPLDSNLWGMKMINAVEAHKYTLGSKKVRVGVMDTGVQGDHPDLAANFNRKLSRNFTTDMPDIDGPCETANCVDPVGQDDNGHGTHVAGTIAASLDGFGVSGVAPKVDIVEVRAGQDSGYFFVGPTVNALTYSGDAGLDAVNMSFYVDPWAYNCAGGAPEDTPEQAADQDVIIEAMNRALNYAHDKGVTLLGAAGNGHTDLANPGTDTSSPDYGEDPHPRTIDNSNCWDLPVEGPHVLGITSLGPSGKKSDFSNYSTEPNSGEIELSAPGGWYRDGFGTDTFSTNENLILSTVPLVSLQDTGEVDADGNITEVGQESGVIKQCQDRPRRGTTACGYYAWYQGTSMATPHATGVAALAVSAHGKRDKSGLGMDPDKVAALLARTATNHACPEGGVQSYTDEGRDESFTATCVGDEEFNGFYGAGIVNALGVVR